MLSLSSFQDTPTTSAYDSSSVLLCLQHDLVSECILGIILTT